MSNRTFGNWRRRPPLCALEECIGKLPGAGIAHIGVFRQGQFQHIDHGRRQGGIDGFRRNRRLFNDGLKQLLSSFTSKRGPPQ